MTVTTSRSTISNDLGELIVNGDVWNCVLTKEASDAISAIDWNGEFMEITFRRNGNVSDPYVYLVKGESTVSDMLSVVESVLNGVSATIDNNKTSSSVGVMYNQLLKNQQLILA